MPTRVVALLLSLVLLWSGFSTMEVPPVPVLHSLEQDHAVANAGSQAGEHEGSVEHHHLDDLPSPPVIDPPTEPPGLLPAPLTRSAQSVVMAQPRAFALAGAGPPFLAGPLRPPCSSVIAS